MEAIGLAQLRWRWRFGMGTMTSTGTEVDVKPLTFGLPACIPEMLPEPLARGTVMNKYQEERGNLHFKCGDEAVVLNSLAVTHSFHTHGNCSNLEQFSI